MTPNFSAFRNAIDASQMDLAKTLFDNGIEALLSVTALPLGKPTAIAHAVSIGYYCARFLDRSRSHLSLLISFMNRFDASVRHDLAVMDSVRLDVAAGVVAFHRQQLKGDGLAEAPGAIYLFNSALEIAKRNGLQELVPIAKFYLGRSYYRIAQYAEALKWLAEAKEALRSRQSVARIEMVEGYIHFLRGDDNTAKEYLDRAEANFTEDGALKLEAVDYVEDTNVRSFHGRIQRNAGDYKGAIAYFEAGAKTFRDHLDKSHKNYARILTQMALTKILHAHEMSTQPRLSSSERAEKERKSDHLRSSAAEDLVEARAIYANGHEENRQAGPLAATYVFEAWLKCDIGEHVVARRLLKAAWDTTRNVDDPVAKAQCRLMQAVLEREDQQMAGASRRAREYAQEALTFALETDRRRLIARAYVGVGLTLVRSPFNNIQDAKKCLDEATKRIKEHDRDYLRTEYEVLCQEVKDASDGEQKRRIAEVTLTEALGKGLERILQDLETKIVRAVHRQRRGSIRETAELLQTSRNRVRSVLERKDD